MSNLMMAGNHSMLVTLTVGELMSLVKDIVHEELRPIRERVIKDGYGVTDIRGQQKICTLLCCTPSELSRLVNVECLGKVLYKDKSKGGNAAIYGTLPMLRTRFKAYRNFSQAECQAWDALGAEAAEVEWKRRGY